MIREIVKGYLLTLRHFFSPPVTVQYPEVRREPFPRYRGFPALRRDEAGKERCVVCALCVAVCPARCIEMVTGEGPDGKKFPFVYRIEVGRCLYCGLCAEVCPVEAVVLTRKYELSTRLRSGTILDKEELLERGKGE
jgi:NADH-quinone oxidoreductase chain I